MMKHIPDNCLKCPNFNPKEESCSVLLQLRDDCFVYRLGRQNGFASERDRRRRDLPASRRQVEASNG